MFCSICFDHSRQHKTMAPPIVPLFIRDRVRHYLMAGYSISMVIKACKLENITVSYGTVQKIKSGGYETKDLSLKQKPKQQPLKVMTKAKLNRLDKMISEANPPTQRDMAKKLKVCQQTVNHHIHKTLKKKTRKKPKVHSLNTRQIEIRKNNSLPLYKKLSSNWEKIITTDEAWFYRSDSQGKRDIHPTQKKL